MIPWCMAAAQGRSLHAGVFVPTDPYDTPIDPAEAETGVAVDPNDVETTGGRPEDDRRPPVHDQDGDAKPPALFIDRTDEEPN